ncbi:MAG: polysaccharide biosynthesis/export family protein [Deltaproteobacteria bacterium]|nr:polysaccharide biosynthesis/export family protein [Deltaproteobacteria bacterium]
MIFLVPVILAGLLLLNSCSPVTSSGSPDNGFVTNTNGANPVRRVTSTVKESNDLERLASLWHRRSQDRSTGDYPVGAGDVLVIHVAGMEELSQRTVRVSGTGVISLPYVGLINVTGMTENELSEDIRNRLEKNIMHDPQVTLLAKETLSRQVAVIGAVHKPGLYNLASSSDTIFGMISRAGGMKSDAAERILLIPAEPAERDKARELMAVLPAQVVMNNPTPLVLKNVDPIAIHLDRVVRGGHEMYLSIPARPGDVIMVPGSGQVLVQGWIAKPGSYKITPGLTVLGAVAAAGGEVFAADTSAVEIIRADGERHKMTLVADLQAIKRGEQQDVSLQEGDVINVSSSAPRLAAYGMYRLFTTIVHVGANIPLF